MEEKKKSHATTHWNRVCEWKESQQEKEWKEICERVEDWRRKWERRIGTNPFKWNDMSDKERKWRRKADEICEMREEGVRELCERVVMEIIVMNWREFGIEDDGKSAMRFVRLSNKEFEREERLLSECVKSECEWEFEMGKGMKVLEDSWDLRKSLPQMSECCCEWGWENEEGIDDE